MGSSFTEFRGRGFWTHDLRLEVWIHQVCSVIDRMTEEGEHVPSWLIVLREDWERFPGGPFNGWISPGLDGHLTTDEQVETMLGVSERALVSYREQGETIPNEYFKNPPIGDNWSDVPAVRDQEVPTRPYERVGEVFVALLKGEIEWDASTSPMV